MGILQQFDKSKNIIHVVWDGDVTGAEWLHQALKAMSRPEWPSISRLIIDVHTVHKNDSIGTQEMETVAGLFGIQPEAVMNKRIAAIANNLFGRARTFSTLVAPFGVAMVVFNRVDTACIFLGIDPASTEQTLEGLRRSLRHEIS